MEINFSFSLFVSLNFIVKFEIDSNNKQDFFICHGENSTAHLFRMNDTLKLFLIDGSNYEHHQLTNISTLFEFKWRGFKINEQNMKLVKARGEIGDLKFNSFTFLSPYLELAQGYTSELSNEAVYWNLGESDYGFLDLIFLCIGVLLKSDVFVIKFC